jgi:hypothetical protein
VPVVMMGGMPRVMAGMSRIRVTLMVRTSRCRRNRNDGEGERTQSQRQNSKRPAIRKQLNHTSRDPL